MQHLIDESEKLAALLGVPLQLWEEVLGRGWVPADDEGWHLRGRPVQLMVRVDDGGVVLGLPTAGAAPATLRVSHTEHVGRDEFPQVAPEVVRWTLATRRRQFRWCPRCWLLTPPESWHDGQCLDCAGN